MQRIRISVGEIIVVVIKVASAIGELIWGKEEETKTTEKPKK